MAFARTIVEEHAASGSLDAARQKYPRFEEFWEGWSWRLARNPAVHAYSIPDVTPPAYLIKSPDLSQYGLPHSVTILYRFDAEQVSILGVKIAD
jgi:hypothetical protein